jgi:putative oxidoreductase
MVHGYAKLSRGPDSFAAVLHGLGVPFPGLMSWATILVELIGGVAILAGAFLAIVSVPMIVTMLVAVFSVHLPYGFSSIKLIEITDAGPRFGPPGYETALLYVACLVALVWNGAGPFSIDALMVARAKDDAAERATKPFAAKVSRELVRFDRGEHQ